jgi:very-short-patch-repair endonuclease/predicted transcriptional regulator of viral defense system
MARAEESTIARLAAQQRGVVTVEQLHAAGLDNAAIKRRCRAGRLHRLHRGIYLVGLPIVPAHAAETAALLACGRGSVVSHRSAARLWGLPAWRDWSGPIEVTVPGGNPGRKPGLMVHRAHKLDRRDVRPVDGIPATAPARTLLDLATVMPIDELELALADAHARRLLRPIDLADALDRNRGRRGAKALRALLALALGNGLTRSQAERRMLALLREAALPLPNANARAGHYEVDFLWSDQKVIVEVDGYAFHSARQSFERDRERDAVLVARGYVVMRVTWRQLVARRHALVARIAAALAVRE